MSYGHLNIELRPIKLAFIIDPSDKSTLLEAISINTYLWGGQYNPIIPITSRVPKSWTDLLNNKLRINDIIEGYIDAYDPDFIVTIGNVKLDGINIGNREIITHTKIIDSIRDNHLPKYGISLFEILNYFIDKEFKFVRREPINISIPNFGNNYKTFLASLFGILSSDLHQIFERNYKKILNAKIKKCTLNNYTELFDSGNLFLRRLSNLYLSKRSKQTHFHDSNIFFIDASNFYDIIDYWNLRAIGWNILPIPKQLSSNEKTRELVKEYIEKNFYPLPNNPKIYHFTNILKSRIISVEDVKKFINSLEITPSKDTNEHKYGFQHWYPRIWEEWARDPDNVECCEVYADTKELEIPAPQESFNIKILSPRFLRRAKFLEPRYANELNFRIYSSQKLYAEVFPEGDYKLLKSTGWFGPKEWRFSKKAIVYFSNFPKRSVLLKLLKADIIFTNWLELKNWKIEYSNSGLISMQMLRLLGTKYNISILANDGIIKLLTRLSEGKTIKEEKLWGEISKIANNSKILGGSKRIFNDLTNLSIIQLGLEIQCPTCSQHSWYSIKDLNYELQCIKCLASFHLNSYSPRELKWSYRSFGPFNLPFQAYGAYSVLLTLRFFSQLYESYITPMLSFKAKKNHVEIEADLGLLLREQFFSNEKIEVIFAECKTYNDFKKRDCDRMRAIAKEFPGSTLVFSTLKTSLSTKEKKVIRPFVERCSRYWKNDRPYNLVLILTGNELFGYTKPPFSWHEIGESFKKKVEKFGDWLDLFQLSDASQQIYLDLPSLHSRWDKELKKKYKRIK